MSSRVLHVTESFGGGVAAAIDDYAQATPEFTHDVLFATRADSPVSVASPAFDTTIEMPAGHLARALHLRRTVQTGRYDIVHAHSSYAGFYARIALSKKRMKIVYTPHCYAFERRDIPAVARWLFRLTERILSANTTTVAACSPREKDLASRMGASSILVPNRPPSDAVEPQRESVDRPRTSFHVVGAGRLSAQKDFPFFVRCVEALSEAGIDVRATWLGGQADTCGEHRSNLITVTGWLSRFEVLRLLPHGDLYIHTAQWEGFPVAVLEALALGIPTVARAIPAFDGIAIPKFDSPADLIDLVHGWDADVADTVLRQGRMAVAAFDAEGQSLALRSVYETDARET